MNQPTHNPRPQRAEGQSRQRFDRRAAQVPLYQLPLFGTLVDRRKAKSERRSAA